MEKKTPAVGHGRFDAYPSAIAEITRKDDTMPRSMEERLATVKQTYTQTEVNSDRPKFDKEEIERAGRVMSALEGMTISDARRLLTKCADALLQMATI